MAIQLHEPVGAQDRSQRFMNPKQAEALLREAADWYNRPHFIALDPISIPHAFRKSLDREVAGLLAATLAWGQRPTILRNTNRILDAMEQAPGAYLLEQTLDKTERLRFKGFVHRTFSEDDLWGFLLAMQYLLKQEGSFEPYFRKAYKGDVMGGIVDFRAAFVRRLPLPRTHKHISDPGANSAAKRINMFLRWMVRKDTCGVDFGIWKNIHPASLQCPLDVHSGKTARQLGLLHRKQNDWKAVEELTGRLRELDPEDPVRFDFALFGLGVDGGHLPPGIGKQP